MYVCVRVRLSYAAGVWQVGGLRERGMSSLERGGLPLPSNDRKPTTTRPSPARSPGLAA